MRRIRTICGRRSETADKNSGVRSYNQIKCESVVRSGVEIWCQKLETVFRSWNLLVRVVISCQEFDSVVRSWYLLSEEFVPVVRSWNLLSGGRIWCQEVEVSHCSWP